MAERGTSPVPLGEDWWVFYHAVGLGRRLGEKKGREVLLLAELKKSSPGFPEGTVLSRETPDFVVESSDGRKVGMELVEVYRGGKRPKGGSPHREREGAEEDVVRLAERLYYAHGHPGPVHALLTFPPPGDRWGPLPLPVREIAGAVAKMVREGASEWADGGRLEVCPAELEGTPLTGVLHGLSAHRTGYVGEDGRDSPWGKSLSYATAAAGIGDLAPAISSKDRVY